MTMEHNTALGMASDTAPSSLLFVDDESSILKSLQRLFRPHGYRILTAESGAAGLEILAANRVDLVISDMRMPEMDGAQFLEKVRAKYPEVIRIILTGFADITSIVAAINHGEIYRFITKPWEENSILLTVRDALERYRLLRENARLLELTQRQNEELKVLNEDLERRVQERTRELEKANRDLNSANDHLHQNFLLTIKIFSHLVELREGSVGGHARRVADMARKLAVRMKLEEEDQQDVIIAALLHDIGKIGFPDALFARSITRMSLTEIERYHKHSVDGASALMPLAELYQVAGIIRSHHERFDGRGFPDGLIDTAIPLGARILAICNDYDCLLNGINTDRKLDAEKAKETITQTRGQRYDPQVMDVFLEMLRQPGEESGPDMAVPVDKLKIGMVLARDLLSSNGAILLAADFVLDARLIHSIQLYAAREGHALVLHIRPESILVE